MSEQQQQPVFNIEKVYLKDASLEVPNAPEVFMESGQPQFEVHLLTDGKRINEALYEVFIKTTLTAKKEDKVLFLVEVSQAGIFQIRNVPENEINPVLGIACPTILFPYARETIADLVTRAGFPPIHLAPVNFEGMYAARQSKKSDDGPKIEIAH
ncbi:MAG TPA: protein-export chaperone SecB [Burkholderiales bacterium]|nr:protein-export chaperone SecB [Burkholderiales bacterium]